MSREAKFWTNARSGAFLRYPPLFKSTISPHCPPGVKAQASAESRPGGATAHPQVKKAAQQRFFLSTYPPEKAHKQTQQGSIEPIIKRIKTIEATEHTEQIEPPRPRKADPTKPTSTLLPLAWTLFKVPSTFQDPHFPSLPPQESKHKQVLNRDLGARQRTPKSRKLRSSDFSDNGVGGEHLSTKP